MIRIFGMASGRTTVLEVKSDEINENLLVWLRSRGITVASSCDGKGVCKKCVIQNGWATCELTLKSFLERQPDGKIEIDYL